MTINRKTLLSACAPLLALCNRRTTVPALACFHVDMFANTLIVRATNLDEYLEVSVLCDCSDAATVLVPAKSLVALISDGPETIELEEAKDALMVKCGAASVIKTEDVKSFPPFPDAKFTKIGINCQDLANCIEIGGWASSDARADRLEGNFTRLIHVLCTPTNMLVESSNRAIYTFINKPLICADLDLCISDDYKTRIVEALKQDGAVLSVSENHIKVEHDNGLWIGRRSEIKWPDLSKFRDEKAVPICKLFTKPLLEHLNKCQSFVEMGWLPITIDWEADSLRLSFSSKVLEKYEATIPVGETTSIHTSRLNLTMAIEAFRHMDKENAVSVGYGSNKLILNDGQTTVFLAELKKV